MFSIPDSYYNQAVKPRGETVNERLNFLLNWYSNTGKKVAQESTWSMQIDMNNTMFQYSSLLRPLLSRDTDEETKKNIEAFIPVAFNMAANSRNAGSSMFFSYLYIELGKVIGA